MYLQLLLLVCAASHSSSFLIRANGCSIDIRPLEPQPIVVLTNTTDFLYPDDSGTITIPANAPIDIGCPGGKVRTSQKTYNESVTATCVSGTQFLIDNQQVQFTGLSCSKNAYHTAQFTGNSCEDDNLEAEIGYIVNNKFVQQIRLCFDAKLQTTLYAEFLMPASIGLYQSGVSRPGSFIQDSFYDVGGSVDYLYKTANQRVTINKLLGLSSTSTKYIQNNDYFLSRGHYSAKADFVYATQQRATFHFVNVAPQWQTFNGRNWNNIEMWIRDYADVNSLDLQVIVGTYGVTTLPHEETGEEVELFLYVDGEERGIPVPELYWKIVYEASSKKGVALVGVNNPYKKEFTPICDDVSEEVEWIDWSVSGQENGFIYACKVDDLRKNVTYIPNLEITQLLA